MNSLDSQQIAGPLKSKDSAAAAGRIVSNDAWGQTPVTSTRGRESTSSLYHKERRASGDLGKRYMNSHWSLGPT